MQDICCCLNTHPKADEMNTRIRLIIFTDYLFTYDGCMYVCACVYNSCTSLWMQGTEIDFEMRKFILNNFLDNFYRNLKSCNEDA